MIDRAPERLLRGHVVRRARDAVLLRGLGLGAAPGRYAEVADLDDAILRDHEVVGLDVAVDDAVALRVLEAARRVEDDRERPLDGEPALLAEEVLDAPSRHVLHGVEADGLHLVLGDADVVDLHDVRVVELARGARLGREAVHELRVRRELGREDLEGDASLERDLDRLVDGAHAAASEETADPVARELGLREIALARPLLLGGHLGADAPGLGHPRRVVLALVLEVEDQGLADLDLVVGPELGRADARSVDERAVRGVEVLELGLVELVGDLEVPPRDLLVAEPEVRLEVTPYEEGSVLQEGEDLALVLPLLHDQARHSGALPVLAEDLVFDPVEERAPDAHGRGALLDRHFQVVAHAHGEAPRRAEGREAREKLAELREVGPRSRGVVRVGRHRHEPLDAEVRERREAPDERLELARGDARLLLLAAGVDLDVDREWGALAPLVELLRELERIERVEDGEDRGDLVRLVALEVSHHVPAGARSGDGRVEPDDPLGAGLSQVERALGDERLDERRPAVLRHEHERDRRRVAPCLRARGGEAVTDAAEVRVDGLAERSGGGARHGKRLARS